jgi:hypothetical protein
MHTKALAVIFLFTSPLLASAGDGSVAWLTQIDGNVLLSTGQSMASATGPIRLVPGTRVLPTSNSFAEVTFDDGCRVKVGPGQRYEVDHEPPCGRAPAVETEPHEMETRR